MCTSNTGKYIKKEMHENKKIKKNYYCFTNINVNSPNSDYFGEWN